jgi:hypothetical protein
MAIANAAAATFLTELNDYSKSVAPFVITHQANLAKKVPKVAGGYASVALDSSPACSPASPWSG